MEIIDRDKLKKNTCDDDMLVELVTMGIKRIDKAGGEFADAIAEENWDGLSRVIHKLRPIIFYIGIVSIDEQLQQIENNSQARVELENVPAQIDKMLEVLAAAKLELNDILSNITVE